MFKSKKYENNVYPCKPQFYYIKVGCKGSTLHGHVCMMKSSENIQKKEDGPDRSILDNQSSSVTLIELAKKARKNTVILSFSNEVIQ